MIAAAMAVATGIMSDLVRSLMAVSLPNLPIASAGISLRTGKTTGNFRNSTPHRALFWRRPPLFAKRFRHFAGKSLFGGEAGLFSKRTGNSFAERRIR
jgi:hypothetical protein